jgi:DNA processing protein
VTDAAEVRELAATNGADLAAAVAAERAADARAARPGDRLDPVARRVLDAMPRRVPAELERVASVAGVSVAEARSSLGLLELDGWVVRRAGGWIAVSRLTP